MRKIFVLILPFLILLSNCEEENPTIPVGTNPVLSQPTAPDTLYFVSESDHFISITVNDPQGLIDIAVVTCTIFPSGSEDAVKTDSLVDDGTKGDIIPLDGIFTTSIDAGFAQAQTGSYSLVFKAIDLSGNESDTVSHQLTIVEGEENIAPSITDVTLPATFDIKETNNYHLVTVKVIDPQGQDDIKLVLLQVFSPVYESSDSLILPILEDTLMDTGENGDEIANDGIYSNLFNSAFAEDEVGKFSFYFQAYDSSNAASDAVVKIVDVIRSDNDPPAIFDLIAPSSMKLIPDDFAYDTLYISASDAQGLNDIREVYFHSLKPNGEYANSGNPLYLTNKGEGLFSYILMLPYESLPGDYTFTFEAVDKSDAKSNQITHILTVTQ